MNVIALRALLVAGTFAWASISSVASAQYYYVSCQPTGWSARCNPQPQCGYWPQQASAQDPRFGPMEQRQWDERQEWMERSQREERVAERSSKPVRKASPSKTVVAAKKSEKSSSVRTVSSSSSRPKTHYASSYSRAKTPADQQKKAESLTVKKLTPLEDVLENVSEDNAAPRANNAPPDLPEPREY